MSKSALKACVATAGAGKLQQEGHTQAWRQARISSRRHWPWPVWFNRLERHPYTKPKGVGLDIDPLLGRVQEATE